MDSCGRLGIIPIYCAIFICLALLPLQANTEKIHGLYNKTDDVIILDSLNIADRLLGSQSMWIVEFYNTWCGHCIQFAPVYKELAKELKGWRPVIQLAAVDCANQNNINICRKYNINAFPSFKFFPPDAKESDPGEFFSEQSKEALIKKALDFSADVTFFEPPASWPGLAPIESMQEIWNEIKDDHHHVAFVFEEPGSYLGRQVILDTFHYKALLVRRMLKDSVLKFGITDFPSLCLINRDGTFKPIAKGENTRDGMVSALLELLSPAQLEAGKESLKNYTAMSIMQMTEDQAPVSGVNEVRIGVYSKDLESTLHYLIRQEVAISRVIDGEKLSALKQFIYVLAKYFSSREMVQNFLQNLADWLRNVGTQITGDQWISAVDGLQTVNVYLPEEIQWVGCAGSEPRFRGYPCGLWTLFHSLSVAAYQQGRENPRDLPLSVLSSIQGYIKHFFGCQICVEHFLTAAAMMKPSDLEPRGAVLWLWQGHNSANLHLHGDASEDPKHPKVQFPPVSLCSDCRVGEEWDREKVLEFLVKFYGKSSVIIEDDHVDVNTNKLTETGALNPGNALDWWELHQRKRDVEKIRELRERKSQKLLMKLEKKKNERAAIDTKGVNLINARQEAIMQADLKVKSGLGVMYGWGFSKLDMGLTYLDQISKYLSTDKTVRFLAEEIANYAKDKQL